MTWLVRALGWLLRRFGFRLKRVIDVPVSINITSE